jgi:glucosamine-6-phosphate deaminase
MDIVILADSDAVAAEGARRIRALLSDKPTAVLGLATGRTPLCLYRNLIEDCKQARVSFARATTFNLDEYVGLRATDTQSYRSYMQRELFDHIDIDAANTYLPSCDNASDSLAIGQEYERLIEARGGIDLQILGIGHNGHIGFNEPTSSLRSRTRLKTLTRETLETNRRYFDSPDDQPQLAVTMGVATIMDASEILLLATGADKAAAACAAIEGPLAAMCPASALQLHQKVTILLDQDAAAELAMRDYYDWIQQQKLRLSVATGSR